MYTNKNFHGARNFGGFIDDVLQNGWKALNEELRFDERFGHAPVNIRENDNNYEIHVVAPGLKKEEFKLNIEKGVLTISYEHKEENKEQQEGKWLRTEHRTRSFKRSFTLNDKVDTAKTAAQYNDGILVISLPKKETAEPASQSITVA
jgi:HSP20 family protein